MEQRFLGEILQRRAGVPAERLEALYAVQREKGIDLVDLLVNGNIIDEATIAKALADESELPYVDRPEPDRISTALATRLPIGFAKSHKILVTNEDDFSVFCLIGDPFDTIAIDELRVLFGKPVEASVAPSERIEDAINRVYEREAGGGELESDEEQVDEAGVGDILDSDDEAPVIRWVNSLFLQAMKERASDIHIEPEEKEVIVRYRIDGELYVARRAPRAFMSSIVSRIKIESALNIAEKRLPQDGRITKKIAGKGFDIRVSTIPTSRGYERIVMRLLNKSSVLLDLPDLGFSGRDYALMDNLIHRPDGIILVTGPTGSGKTTTLYACLNRINQPNINILTAEDPVEYELPQIHQVHVNAKIGLTLRERAPRLPSSGPRRRHGRRDPRQGDGRDRDQRVAHRPPRALHDPHERRRRRVHPYGRHGRRAVLAPLLGHRDPRAAPRPRALPALQGGVRGQAERSRRARHHERARAPRAGSAR